LSVLQEIVSWSRGLSLWQQDAIARLFARQKLEVNDFEDLNALLKSEHGIPDPKARKPAPLAGDQVPVPAQAGTQIELVAIKNLRYVNALAENHRLALGSKGLTVIYGDNGSGKSGYSRVWKRACRARDQGEQILPNANLPSGKTGVPEAVFEIVVNGVAKDVPWVDGKSPPDELSSIAIFDRRCERAYLDEEDDFSYVPYGLDILEELAKAFRRLKESIDAEHRNTTPDLTPFEDLKGETAVGRLIGALSAKSNPADVVTLATVSEAEIARRDEIDRSLKESNPKARAAQLTLCAKRMARVARSASDVLAKVDAAAEEKLKVAFEAHLAARQAAEIAAKGFKADGQLLPGTGSDAWKELFAAARKFSAEAYSDRPFPYTEEGARCVLCQQPLDEGTERMRRFEAFVQQEAEKVAQVRRGEFDNTVVPFLQLKLSLGITEEGLAELEGIDNTLAEDVIAFERALGQRHTTIKTALESGLWGSIAAPPESPVARLSALVGKLTSEAETLEKTEDEKARVVLQKELAELNARISLAPRKDAVLAALERFRLQQKLALCSSALNTRGITTKAAELTEKTVSRNLEVALNREFKALGAAQLKVVLQTRPEKGKALHKLKLNLPQARELGAILSEGEQRAVAIGSFLAEVGLSGSSGGIIFDDPVSSLDHLRRENVARRLVEEAKVRQVIVLTHEIFFVCLLMESADRAGVRCLTQTLTQREEGFGVPEHDLPFEGKKTKDRVGALRALQQDIAKHQRDGNEPERRRKTVEAYRSLRLAWERATEEVLFHETVLRFRKSIETNRLAGVSVTDQDYAVIEAGMTKSSNHAHDGALLGRATIPDPDELLADIGALDDWRKEVMQRGDVTQKSRKR